MLFDQWQHDCLAYLLKLMSQFSVMPSDFDTGAHDDIFDLLDSPVKKMRKNKPPMEKFVVPRLDKVLLLLAVYSFKCVLIPINCCFLFFNLTAFARC